MSLHILELIDNEIYWDYKGIGGVSPVNKGVVFVAYLNDSDFMLTDWCNRRIIKECQEWYDTIEERAVKVAEEEEQDQKLSLLWEEWEESNEIIHALRSFDQGPDDIAHPGAVWLVAFTDYADGNNYISHDLLSNPTWGEVMLCFDWAIQTTGDYHHCYLEGLDELTADEFQRLPDMLKVTGYNPYPILTFSTGS